MLPRITGLWPVLVAFGAEALTICDTQRTLHGPEARVASGVIAAASNPSAQQTSGITILA